MSSGEVLTDRQAFEQGVGVYEHARFGRVITAMVTPFDEDPAQTFNPDSAQKLARHLAQNGSEGLVLAGTTGESPALSHAEEIELFTAVREAVDIPILAGVGKMATTATVELARQVAELELADGLLVVTPPYVRPTQAGLRHHFREVASATDLPVVVYDIPVRTGQGLEPATLLDIAQLPTVVGLKDAVGNVERTRGMVDDLPADFMIYSGDDGLNLRFLREVGAVGAISVASHWAGTEMGAMFDLHEAGDHEGATAVDALLRPSYEFETSAEARNPIPTKAMLRAALLMPVGYGRSPMVLDSRDADIALEIRASEIHDRLKGAAA